MKKISWTNWAFIFILIVLAYLIIPQASTFKVTWDLFGNYIYLPLLFDRHDLILQDLSYVEAINNIHHVSPALYQFVETQEGFFYTKYTIGWAILQLPFYLIAEAWAILGGYSTDGFSFPYQCMMHLGAFFYVVLGLYFVKKLVSNFFSDKFSALLLLLLVFGTNLFVTQYTMTTTSHLLAFCFLSLLILRIIRYNENPSFKNAIIIGSVLGILTLIRPPDGIFGILILLWGVASWRDLKMKLRYFFIEKKSHTVGMIVIFLIVLSPQLFYWYLSTGIWLLNSYANNTGEGFDLTHPHTLQFLFSFKKGWFIYTPLMILAIFGGWKMWKTNSNGIALVLSSLLFLYLISSWTTWWYAASFGQRAAIDMYPITIVFVGYFIQHAWQSYLKYFLGTFIVLALFLNLIQFYQYKLQIVSDYRMTKEYYFSTFFQFTPPTIEQNKLLAIDREIMWREGFNNKENYKSIYFQKEIFSPIDTVSVEDPYAKEINFAVYEYVQKSHVWLQLTWQYQGNIDDLRGTVFYVSTVYNNEAYTWVGYELDQKFVRHDTLKNEIQFDYLSPHIRGNSDEFCIGACKMSGEPIILKSRRIEIFEPIVDYE